MKPIFLFVHSYVKTTSAEIRNSVNICFGQAELYCGLLFINCTTDDKRGLSLRDVGVLKTCYSYRLKLQGGPKQSKLLIIIAITLTTANQLSRFFTPHALYS